MRAAIYARCSLPTQHISTQLLALTELCAKRGLDVVAEYEDRGSCGSKARRPGLDLMLSDARRRKFAVIVVAAFDRLAKSTRHFLQVLDELGSLGVEFISVKESIDTTRPTGRPFLALVGCINGLEGALVRERICQGMARRRLEGFRLGRAPLNVDRDAIVHDRLSGKSLTETAKKHGVSRASVVRFVHEAQRRAAPVEQFLPVAANTAVEMTM